MPAPNKSINAWILLDEDNPSQTNYLSADSCYQTLIRYGVYQYANMVNICFFDTIPIAQSKFYDLQIGNINTRHPANDPKAPTTGDYLKWVVRDARAANPSIKLLATLNYNDTILSRIFAGLTPKDQQSAADAFAGNVLACLQNNDLDGFDVDWEGAFSYSISKEQFAMLFQAIRKAFDSQNKKHYYLTLSPADVGKLDATTVNTCFDFVNLQLYGGASPGSFTSKHVDQDLLAYGAKFESRGEGEPKPYQTAQEAYQGYTDGKYQVLTQWRLNSGNFQFEQAQQIVLYQLVYGNSGMPFDDSNIIGAAGNPPITSIVVRSGDVLTAIMPTSTGSYQGARLKYEMPLHGGSSVSSTVTLDPGDVITQISGYTGVWFGWNCVLQLTLQTRKGKVYGPFGTMNNSTSKTAFRIQAPAGQSVLAFQGTLVNVPLTGGGATFVVATLNATCGVAADAEELAA